MKLIHLAIALALGALGVVPVATHVGAAEVPLRLAAAVAPAQLPGNVTFDLRQTAAGALEGIPEGAAPTGPITVREAKFAGPVSGALVGTMALTVTVTMNGPQYTTGTYTSAWTITAGANQGALAGVATGAVTTALTGWPPTEVSWNAAKINVTAQSGTGIFSKTTGTGTYSDSGKYTVPPIAIPTPPAGQPPGGSPPSSPYSYARLGQAAEGATTGAMTLDLNGWAIPLLASPEPATALASLGTTLDWRLPPGTTQYHLQVVPANNDGPGIDLIRDAAQTYAVAAPVMGQGPYVMLPGMGYTWRLRATSKPAFAPADDPAWGPWSDGRVFRTPPPTPATISLVTPGPNETVAAAQPATVRWANSASDIFYYEVQVSGDPAFDTGPTATSFVWWNLVHGGVSNPPNAWTTPALPPGTYHWRVRPRVQGDGTPVAWSQSVTFNVVPSPAASGKPQDLTPDYYSADGPFARAIPSNPELDPNSSQLVQSLIAANREQGFVLALKEWTVPVYYATPNTPRYDVTLTAEWAPVRTMKGVPIPDWAAPDPEDDGQMTILDLNSGCEYDFWQAKRQGAQWTASWGNTIRTQSNGVFPKGLSTRGSGFGLLAGVIWPNELRQGRIDHALVFTYSYPKTGGPVAPATESDGESTRSDAIPEGARVQLDPSLDLDSLGLTAHERTIAKALQEYGMILGDSGGGIELEAVPPMSAQNNPYAGLLPDQAAVTLSTIPVERFRVLKLAPQNPDPELAVVPTGCAPMG